MKTLISTILFSLAITTTVRAQDAASTSNEIIGYSGRLYDSAGGSLSGPVDLQVKIWAVEVGGNPETDLLFSQSFTALELMDGYFSIELTDNEETPVTTDPLPVGVFAEVDDAYFEFIANTELLKPRRRVTAVPYAANAYSASLPNGYVDGSLLADDAVESIHLRSGAVDSNAIASGAVGADAIGVDAIEASHIATGAVGAEELAPDAVTMSKLGDDVQSYFLKADVWETSSGSRTTSGADPQLWSLLKVENTGSSMNRGAISGVSTDGTGSGDVYGVMGVAAGGANNYAIYGEAPIQSGSYAGYFYGMVYVHDYLSVGGTDGGTIEAGNLVSDHITATQDLTVIGSVVGNLVVEGKVAALFVETSATEAVNIQPVHWQEANHTSSATEVRRSWNSYVYIDGSLSSGDAYAPVDFPTTRGTIKSLSCWLQQLGAGVGNDLNVALYKRTIQGAQVKLGEVAVAGSSLITEIEEKSIAINQSIDATTDIYYLYASFDTGGINLRIHECQVLFSRD